MKLVYLSLVAPLFALPSGSSPKSVKSPDSPSPISPSSPDTPKEDHHKPHFFKSGSVELSIMEQDFHYILRAYVGKKKAERVLNHGCHCAKFNHELIGRDVGGEAVDELDNLCKLWYSARTCTHKENGACHYSSTYYYSISNVDKYVTSGTCMNDDRTTCDGALCAIDKYYGERMKAEFDLRRIDVDFDDNPTCDKSVVVEPKDSCCGVFPDHKFYNSMASKCENGDVMPLSGQASCQNGETWDENSQSCSAVLTALLTNSDWEQNSLGFYVHVSDNKMTWDAAQTYCQALGTGAEMAMPANSEQNNIFLSTLKAKTSDFGWWGFKRFNAADTQTWNGADGRDVSWTSWCSNEPNNSGGNERCAVSWSGNSCWNDINCGNTYRAMCVYYG